MKAMVKEYSIVTIGTLIVASGVFFFMLPSNVVAGSLTGLVMVLTNFIPIKISVLTFILNAFLLVIGFIFIGKEFGGKTVYSSILLPIFLGIFEFAFPNNQSLTNDVLLDTICYLLIVSVGIALLFRVNASSGGLDIVAKILNKYAHIELGKAMSIAGMVTAFSSILVYDKKTLVMSILATYANGIILDNFIDGYNRRKRVCILSSNYEQIQDFITNELKRGVTLYQAIGGYKKEEKTEIVTILTRSEYGALLNYLHSVDKSAFVTVSTVNEVVGEWNSKRRWLGR
ncbi:MAG: YitT family protein [Tyzzerella sp.]|nr:YitT family protein [Tyzzerella sp.]